MRKIDFVFFDAGGGHRAAATALKAAAEQQQRKWKVRLVNLQDVLDPLDIFRRFTGLRMQDIYNRMLASGWTLGARHLLPPMHATIRMYHAAQVKMLAAFWAGERPDLVVSVVPNFNRALLQGLQTAHPGVPFVTILTDFADYPPHFWMEPQDQFYICGTEKAVEQARNMGHPAEKTWLVSGMILRPTFYDPMVHDRSVERQKLGLDPHKPVGLVLFGGHGSSRMTGIAKRLQASGLDLQLILICGRNENIANELRSAPARFPMYVEGFTDRVPYYMSLSDFFIGKPGPGSISEALAMHLPVIIERNSWTLPQERYNAQWVEEKGVGIVVRNFSSQIVDAVQAMLAPGAMRRYQANAAAIENRAVFEIPDILEEIMDRGGAR